MKHLLLWLEGPLQSWGTDSRFDLRKTQSFPSLSGIYGMLLAASGDSGPQEELLARMANGSLTVITFKSKSRILMDFHMVGNGYDEKDPWESLNIPRKSDGTKAVGGGAKRTYREYLQDQLFAVILELPDDLAERFAQALQQPVYDLYLGRKCCAPSAPVFRGVYNTKAETAEALKAILAEYPEERRPEPDKMIIPAADGSDTDAFLVNDVPVRFGIHRLYRDRWIIRKKCDLSALEQ